MEAVICWSYPVAALVGSGWNRENPATGYDHRITASAFRPFFGVFPTDPARTLMRKLFLPDKNKIHVTLGRTWYRHRWIKKIFILNNYYWLCNNPWTCTTKWFKAKFSIKISICTRLHRCSSSFNNTWTKIWKNS